jgi:uncharacterized protein YciI
MLGIKRKANMEFLITAFDGTDSEALSRRLAARTAHLELGNKMIAEGSLLYAAAILDDNDVMVGSSMIVDLPSRKEVDNWLAVEPYVTGNVWKTIEVRKCRTGPAFARKK